MDELIEYVLLHRIEADEPAAFLELRRCAEVLWECSGATKTWGQAKTQSFRSPHQAQAYLKNQVRAALERGYTISVERQYRRGEFDFVELRAAVKEAAKKSFEIIRARRADQTLCGFALLTDDDAMTISPVANSIESIAENSDPRDPEEAIFNVSAWAFDDGNAWFDVPYRMILRQHRDVPFDQRLPLKAFKQGAFDSFVEALLDLRKDGVFAAQREQFALLVQVSDADQIVGMASKLNSDLAFLQGYRDFMGTT